MRIGLGIDEGRSEQPAEPVTGESRTGLPQKSVPDKHRAHLRSSCDCAWDDEDREAPSGNTQRGNSAIAASCIGH